MGLEAVIGEVLEEEEEEEEEGVRNSGWRLTN